MNFVFTLVEMEFAFIFYHPDGHTF